MGLLYDRENVSYGKATGCSIKNYPKRHLNNFLRRIICKIQAISANLGTWSITDRYYFLHVISLLDTFQNMILISIIGLLRTEIWAMFKFACELLTWRPGKWRKLLIFVCLWEHFPWTNFLHFWFLYPSKHLNTCKMKKNIGKNLFYYF